LVHRPRPKGWGFKAKIIIMEFILLLTDELNDIKKEWHQDGQLGHDASVEMRLAFLRTRMEIEKLKQLEDIAHYVRRLVEVTEGR
jgi:hypothetical protein